MARTRSTKGTGKGSGAAAAASAATASRYVLPEESQSPSKLFILPTQATAGALVVSLPNPRYSKPTRYLVCPETGIYEFTKIAAPKVTPRSWLITQDGSPSGEGDEAANSTEDRPKTQAQVSKSAEFYIASKIDPVFLLLPGLMATDKAALGKSEPAKRMFLSSDDHLDRLLQQGSSQLSEALRLGGTRALFESRLASVCDTVEAGDETMYRLSETRLLGLLLSKAQRVSLPKSMEEKFVTKALEAPVLSRKSIAPRADVEEQDSSSGGDGGASTPQPPDANDSQSSVSTISTSASAASEASTAATSVAAEEESGSSNDEVVAAMQASEEVVRLQRLRTAFSFICSSYLPPSLTPTLKKLLAAENAKPAAKALSVDIAPLDEYLARLAKLRQEATAARSAGDFSRKRVLDDEEEAERAEKRRKKEEEDKRKKAAESRGVRELKKVNVTGMKKLSEFFKKK